MVEETVEHGGSDRAITVEDGSPLFEGFVGGKDDRTAFVASRYKHAARSRSVLQSPGSADERAAFLRKDV